MSIKPALGWIQFSREALRQAEATLFSEEQGVRDEIGFLLLHQGYANRFFPGTSVLQTRLRYILFIPWMYQRIMKEAHKVSPNELLVREEMRLIERLKKHYQTAETSDDSSGIIGGRAHAQKRLTSQPSSMIYWSALGHWGLLRAGPSNVLPSRNHIHRVLRHRQAHTRLHLDDDGQPLMEDSPPFVALPPPPEDWENISAPLSFALSDDTRDERGFLVRHLASVMRADGEQSLLARMAENLFDPVSCNFPWDQKAFQLADAADRRALERARQAASLAAIGRAVYAALVEELREADGQQTEDIHRSNLKVVMGEHVKAALGLDVPAIVTDCPGIDPQILNILEQTRSWLERDENPMALREVYSHAEIRRKGARARLADTLGGRRRREEWLPEQHAKAYPLEYRWRNVRRLLMDLRGEG